MKRNELKKLLEQYSPKKIIFQYINGKINLTSKQIDFLIDLKKGEKKNVDLEENKNR